MVKCIECGKEFKKFYRGKNVFCSKECSYKNWHKNNKSHVREYARSRADINNAARRKKYAENPELRKRLSKISRDYHKANPLKKKEQSLKQYGLSLVEYQNMILEQNNSCAICEKSFVSKRQTHVDHDHKTNKVRGILCESCNLGIGKFYDDINLFQRIIKYLKKKR